MKNILVFCLVLLSAPLALSAQNTRQGKEELPAGYAAVRLGMTVEEVKEALQRDAQFGYRGERDVSLLPGENRVLIETDTSRTAPYSFLDRCYFQFYEDRLYIITINMRTNRLDHYSVFSSLCKKYGNPTTLNPEKSEWENNTVFMSLERPLTIKYTDRAVFERLLNESLVENSNAEKSREAFLEGL